MSVGNVIYSANSWMGIMASLQANTNVTDAATQGKFTKLKVKCQRVFKKQLAGLGQGV